MKAGRRAEAGARHTYLLLELRNIGPVAESMRRDAHYTLFYVREGSGSADIDGARHTVQAGDGILLAPGTDYRLRTRRGDGLHGFEAAFRVIWPVEAVRPGRAAGCELLASGGVIFRCEASSAVDELVDALLLLEQESEACLQLRQQRLFLELLEQIWPSVQRQGAEDADAREVAASAIERTIAAMEQDYGRPMTREQLAAIAGMSPGYYSSLFRKRTGKSPMDRLADIRIAHAKRLLIETDRPLRLIAQSVGYNSEFYFSSRFKQVTGLSPSAYAQRSRSRQLASSAALTSILRRGLRPHGETCTAQPKPLRIAGLFLEDYLTVLGIKPVVQYALGGYEQTYLAPYLTDVVKLDVRQIDYQLLRSASPDMIVLGFPSFASGGQYERFAAIAPTVVFQRADGDWRSTLYNLGELIGRETQAQRAIDHYERKVKQARAALARKVGMETVALVRFHFRDGLCLYSGHDNYISPVLYDDLGLAKPRLLHEWERAGREPVVPIAPELLAELDADHLFLVVDASQQALAQRTMSSDLWNRLPAVRAQRVYRGTTDVWMTFGLIAHECKIEHVLQALL
ncbi:AraC family transcriptional regulator [Paenibacillus sp. IB182496]|uniref:AraC family transcriptional regulator n=1 Tax=Paenibacillus sabuli TaxID=2772509 RepID=A0A927GUL6_9BACL|nr:helix-turn-helix domain-containing protein [Paenibacillus sabuli]MBD2848295.1 AraC family transcriptional regulator [Paenibacillus sabuli]